MVPTLHKAKFGRPEKCEIKVALISHFLFQVDEVAELARILALFSDRLEVRVGIGEKILDVELDACCAQQLGKSVLLAHGLAVYAGFIREAARLGGFLKPFSDRIEIGRVIRQTETVLIVSYR